MDLSLPVPRRTFGIGSVDLTDCLKEFVEPESMEKCGYKCQKCKSVDRMVKGYSVFRYP